MKIILNDLKIQVGIHINCNLYRDNKSTCIAHNPLQDDRTQHIEIDKPFIQDNLFDNLGRGL